MRQTKIDVHNNQLKVDFFRIMTCIFVKINGNYIRNFIEMIENLLQDNKRFFDFYRI
jgi:hypothetical protein